MNRSRWLCCAAALLMFAVVPVAQGQDNTNEDPNNPAMAVRDRCVRAITKIATRCVSKNQDAAAQCVRRIRQLLADGHVARARHVARHRVNAINRKSHAAADRIGRICARCIHALRHLGAPELAQQVQKACDDQLNRIRASRKAAVGAIAKALGGGPADSQT